MFKTVWLRVYSYAALEAINAILWNWDKAFDNYSEEEKRDVAVLASMRIENSNILMHGIVSAAENGEGYIRAIASDESGIMDRFDFDLIKRLLKIFLKNDNKMMFGGSVPHMYDIIEAVIAGWEGVKNKMTLRAIGQPLNPFESAKFSSMLIRWPTEDLSKGGDEITRRYEYFDCVRTFMIECQMRKELNLF